MKPLHRVSLGVMADYHQFYVWDPVLSDRQAPTDYTDEDIARRVKLSDGAVVICPVRNMRVPVEVSIWDLEPPIHLVEWQHVALAPLYVPSGTIQIDECTGSSQAEFTVEAGHYSVRCLFKGLDTISPDGLDGRDVYSIQIWPQRIFALQIVKSWVDDLIHN